MYAYHQNCYEAHERIKRREREGESERIGREIRAQRRKRRPGSLRLRKKVLRSRRRWFSLPAAGRYGSRARTGAMRP